MGEHKKDKALGDEEIEIDINKATPLSKKELRLLKKGKKTAEEFEKEKSITSGAKESKEDGSKEEEKESVSKPEVRSNFAVWIGNLSYETTEEDLRNFVLTKTSFDDEDITRVKLPRNGRKNRGFCYMDFKTEEQMQEVVALSENQVNGRNLLIKASSNFEGRPTPVPKEGNAPSRILFIGNLAFDTTQELLETHFRHCGEIMRVRMATFEDSGKCKGFAFIDFKDQEGAAKALADKSCKRMMGRPLRMEFGEDRSQRKPKRSFDEVSTDTQKPDYESEAKEPQANSFDPNKGFQPKQKKARTHTGNDRRLKSSVALATAQRASAAIVESKGKKITF